MFGRHRSIDNSMLLSTVMFLSINICVLLTGIKIPENCVARVRDELLVMDEEVKRRRKEKEQQALEQHIAKERMRKMEQENKHLLANLFSNKPIFNQSIALSQSQLLNQNLNALQRTQTQNVSQLQRMQTQNQAALQQPVQNLSQLSLQRGQAQSRTHNTWPNNTSSSTNQASLSNSAIMSSSYSPFYPHSFVTSFPQIKPPSVPLLQNSLTSKVSSKDPLDEILDLTVNSPSSLPDSTEAGVSLNGLLSHSHFKDVFDLESLLSQSAQQSSQHSAQPLLLQQQQNHGLLPSNHQDLLDLFDLPVPCQNPTQKASPSSSTSSSSSLSSSSVSNNPVSHGHLSTSTLISTSSTPSVYSPSSSTSLFSNSPFSSSYHLPQADSLPLPNGNCSPGTLDVREALNSMLAGPDRKSVIQYRP